LSFFIGCATMPYMSENGLFRIGEISKLFNIGVDSIRYYEKVGLLHPVRNEENNYRLYTLDDIRTMNTVRELLAIGFSTDEILEFEKDRNLKHVTAMLDEESSVIDEKIRQLSNIKGNIKSRLRSIHEAVSLDTSGAIHELDLPERRCLLISEGSMPDNEINYRLAEFRSDSSSRVTTIGACDCYVLDTEKMGDCGDFATKAIFFYSRYLNLDTNFSLDKGKYLSLAYKGSFTQTPEYYPEMLAYCEEHGLKKAGDLVEFCHIDRYETSDVSEYVTELQMKVSEYS